MTTQQEIDEVFREVKDVIEYSLDDMVWPWLIRKGWKVKVTTETFEGAEDRPTARRVVVTIDERRPEVILDPGEE